MSCYVGEVQQTGPRRLAGEVIIALLIMVGVLLLRRQKNPKIISEGMMNAVIPSKEDSPVAKLLDIEKWPTPKWCTENDTVKYSGYEQQFLYHIRTRYLSLENEYRSVLGNFPQMADYITAARIADILNSSRKILEAPNANLPIISSSLDLVERLMTWLHPPHITRAKIDGMLTRIEPLPFKEKEKLRERLTILSKLDKEIYAGQFRSTLDEAIAIINEQNVMDRVARTLQLDRLKLFTMSGMVTVISFLIATPLFVSIGGIEEWPSSHIISNAKPAVYVWMNSAAVSIFGAVGGFLSGLLYARSSKITLVEFLEDRKKLQLRPLVGALVALIIYTILSWKVLPGIDIVNTGSYFFIAFLSGFSERYFLRLLKTESEENAEKIAQREDL